MTVPIQCPVPDCGFKPPTNLSAIAQERSLARHISLRHGLEALPGVVDNVKAMEHPSAQPTEEPQQEQQPQPEPEPQQPQEKVNVQQREARVNKEATPKASITSIGTPTGDAKKDRINRRTEQWGNYLHQDFNPLLVAYTGKFIGVPDERWLKGGPNDGQPARLITPDGKQVVFWEPTIEQQLTLSEGDCKKLAKAGAVFAESTMGQALTMWMEANAHWIAVGAALMVAGSFGWRVMRLRTEVEQLKAAIEQMSQMQQPQPGANDGSEEATAAA